MEYNDERFHLVVYRDDEAITSLDNTARFKVRFNVDITNKTAAVATYQLLYSECGLDGIAINKLARNFPWCAPQEKTRQQINAYDNDIIYKIQGVKINGSEYVPINFNITYNLGAGGYYSKTCFPGEAKISTPQGEERIDGFKKGNIILSWQQAEEKLIERPVKKLIVHPPTELWQVNFINKRAPLIVTPWHTLLTDAGWKMAGNITGWDHLVVICNIGEQWMRVASVERTGRVEPVYNLITAGEHNFIADGVVAHNFTFMRELRTKAHRSVEAIQAFLTRQKGMAPARG